MKRTPLTRKTPLRRGSSSSLSRQTPITKRNQARLDKRTKAYRAYMASPEWKAKRLEAIIAAGWACQRCGAMEMRGGPTSATAILDARDLHVHHKTYARFGHELAEDLEVICQHCHAEHHAQSFIRPRGLRGGR